MFACSALYCQVIGNFCERKPPAVQRISVFDVIFGKAIDGLLPLGEAHDGHPHERDVVAAKSERPCEQIRRATCRMSQQQ